MTNKSRTDSPVEIVPFDFNKATLDKGFELTLTTSIGDKRAQARLGSTFIDLKIDDKYFLFTQGLVFLKDATKEELTDDYLFGNILGRGLVSYNTSDAASRVSETLMKYPGVDITGLSNGLISLLNSDSVEISTEDYHAIVDSAFKAFANSEDEDYDKAKRDIYRLGRRKSNLSYTVTDSIRSLKEALDKNNLYDLWLSGATPDVQPDPVSFGDSSWDYKKDKI